MITAFIMAGDFISGERAWDELKSGAPFKQALWLVGSYQRVAFCVEAIEAGYVETETVLDLLPEVWPNSDPDDTDPRFLNLWRQAWGRNDFRYLRDGGPLPRNHSLVVYRGQDEGDRLGISWSLNKDIAERFAKGAALRVRNRGGVIYVGKVDRRNVMAYLTGRNEDELIIDPALIRPAVEGD